MAATPPPGYTPPPADLPQRGDRATFSNRVDAWVTWFSTVILTQLAAMIANAYANAVDAFASANTATAQANAAISAAGAVPWVSGRAYAAGESAYSLIDFMSYRRKTAGSGTTDPANDPTNWVPPTQLGLLGVIISDTPGTPVAWTCPNGVKLVEYEIIDGGYSSATSTSSPSIEAGQGGNTGRGSFVPTAGVTYTLTAGAGAVGAAAGTTASPAIGGISTISGAGLTTITTANARSKVPGGPQTMGAGASVYGGGTSIAPAGSGGVGVGGTRPAQNAAANPGIKGQVTIRY